MILGGSRCPQRIETRSQILAWDPPRGEAQRVGQLIGSRWASWSRPCHSGREPGVSVLSLCPPGVFLPPSPAAANEPILEEVGIVALAPLADVLNSPQPSPVAGPIVSPLAGPLNTLLPGPGPTSQSSPLTSLLSSHLASPLVVPQVGTPTSSLGLPSTGSLMPSNPLEGPMAVPPGGTPTSSLGLPSTGPLTPGSPLVGPLAVSQNGPLMPPMTGSGVLSLNSPLLTSTAAPLGVSQNVLANPMNNLVLSEAPRVRLAEPLRGYPPGPHPSADRGPSATSKGNRCRDGGWALPGQSLVLPRSNLPPFLSAPPAHH